MIAWLRFALPIVVLVTAAPGEAAPLWSPTVDGIHARLVVEPTKEAGKPQLALWLEVENVSNTDGGIPLPWGYVGDMLQLALEDGGKPVTPAGIGGSHASGPPYVVALPVGATLRVPINKSSYESPQPGKTLFRPLTFQAWDVPQRHGKLTVRGTLTPHALDKGAKPGPRAWTKPIELPAVELP